MKHILAMTFLALIILSTSACALEVKTESVGTPTPTSIPLPTATPPTQSQTVEPTERPTSTLYVRDTPQPTSTLYVRDTPQPPAGQPIDGPTSTLYTVDTATTTAVLAAVDTALKNCASSGSANPVNCPQGIPNAFGLGDLTGIRWELHGDPLQDATVSGAGDNLFQVDGAFLMRVQYNQSCCPDNLQVITGGYQAIVKSDGHKATVEQLQKAEKAPQVSRPPQVTDEAVLKAANAQLNACTAMHKFTRPRLCPRVDFGHIGYHEDAEVKYTMASDPMLNARVTYDGDTGIFHAIGDYSEKWTTNVLGVGPYEENGSYDAYVSWDKDHLSVIYMEYSGN